MAESLITDQEAEEVVSFPNSIAQKVRLPLLVTLGIIVVIVGSLLVMVLLSLRGTRTGWESLLPFLNQAPASDLQIN